MALLDDFARAREENQWKIYGVDVKIHGETVDARHFFPQKRYPIYSATKSFTATAVGIAQAEGKMEIHQPLGKYLAGEMATLPDNQRKRWQGITIRRLLMMAVAGFPFRPEGEDWIRMSLSCPIGEVPAFSYSNIPAYLVGAALENAVGENLIEYLKPRLLLPLGIENPPYRRCPGGHFYGATGMELTVEELSRLGLLYMQKGMWKGERLLPSQWVQEAVAHQMDTGYPRFGQEGYGYFFWQWSQGFAIRGKWGQRCLVIPEKGIVLTCLSDMPQGFEKAEAVLQTTVLHR